MARFSNQKTGQKKRCMAGCVARYCCGLRKGLRDGTFTNLWILHAAGDARGAVGVAQGAPLPRQDSTVARRLVDEMVACLHQGRMEFRPGPLGGGSIIGDPRSPKMQSVTNLKSKFRESFRPFVLSVMREHVSG